MYKAYCRQSAVMLYFLSATGRTLWHGSSMDTRNDLKISTPGPPDEEDEGLGVEAPSAFELDKVESSGLGVVTAVPRICRVDRGAGVLRVSRLRSDMVVVSEDQVFDEPQLGVS